LRILTLQPHPIPAHIGNDNSEHLVSSPFASAGLDLARKGLTVIPVGGDDGKTPLVKWKRMKGMGATAIAELISKHPDANIGILTGERSRLHVTIIDVDGDGSDVQEAIERFGTTPLMVRTPSNGMHLYYRHNGEGCRNLRPEGLPIDVKGNGGFVVAPPSMRPSGQHAGKGYVFASGDWNDLTRLPTLKDGSLDARTGTANVTTVRSVPRGKRNDFLFKTLMRAAKGCDTFEDLMDVATNIADQHFEQRPDDPFTSAEVEKTVRSVWEEYELKGRNWAGTKGTVQLTGDDINALEGKGDALMLLATLRLNHANRPTGFALSPKAMTKANTIPGWTAPRYRLNRDYLIAKGFLRRTHKGGRRPGDAGQYVLATPVISTKREPVLKGSFFKPNVTQHPPPLGMAGNARPVEGHREIAAGSNVIAFPDLFKDDSPSVALDDLDAWRDGTMPRTIAAALRRIARFRGQTHDDLARVAGLSRKHLTNVLGGKFGGGSEAATRLRTFLLTEAAADGETEGIA
jgi:hypothetical protein